MTPEEVAAEIERMHQAEGGPRPLPDRAPPPQGTALVGTKGPQETFGATPEEISTIRTLLNYIGGEGNEGMVLGVTPEGRHYVAPYEHFKNLASPSGQYSFGDPKSLEEAQRVGSAALVGSMPFPRPAGSLGIFMGMREAEELLYHGRPAAYDALKNAEIMEAAGKSREEIQQAARDIFKQAGENDLGQIWKPDYQGSEWRFELLPKTNTPRAKIAKFDPKNPTRPLGEQYKNPDLYKAMPGIEETELTQFGPVPFGTHAYYDPAIPAAGVKGEIAIQRPSKTTGITTQDQRDLLIAELQHTIQDIKGWPRGGSPKEFEPGGRLAQYVKPGETPQRAYGRLMGEIESKVAKERANYSTKQAREETVEETIDRLWLTTHDPIIEFYRGQRIRSHAEHEKPQKREAVIRGARMNELAENVAKAARQTVADLKAAGVAPEEIAARIQKEYGSPVTAEQVQANRGWWNVSERASYFWTADQRALFLKLHRQGLPYSEITEALRAIGRETNPRAVKDMARREGLEPRQRGGARPRLPKDET